ncbi:MAG: hypothetical protein HY654_07585 [Acidobacteria bacterium]|nr:hypothetical protein [Acidobacteriota bacterium]
MTHVDLLVFGPHPDDIQLIESRDAQFGALIGVTFAEGFVTTGLLEYPHLLEFPTAQRSRS